MNDDLLTIKALVKECLGIIPSATGKDNEIEMLINSAITDMARIGITFDNTNPMHTTAIVQFVKGHFGMIDVSQKELYMQSYNLLITSLQLSL